MARLSAYGLELELPGGWEGRVRRRTPEPGATAKPVVHAATIPLPAERGDYGGGAVEHLGEDDVFVTLFEHDPAAAGSALFPDVGAPREVLPEWFHPTTLQRVLPGQSGAQRFFAAEGRAFCLYVVLGSHARRYALAPRASAVVRSLVIRRER